MWRFASLLCRAAVLLVLPLLATAGETVEQRLVSADAGVTEILFELQVADRLVAVDASSEPPADRQLPRLGYHRALAAEGLIALDPDLLIGSEQMGPPHVLDAVQRAGVDVLALPYPGDIATLRANIQSIAEATSSTRADELIADLDRQAARLSRQSLGSERAALLLRGEGGKLRLAGSGTGGGGFLGLLGAINVADYAGYRSITPEGLLQLAPDVLVLVDTEGQDIDDMLARYPVLRFSPAVRAGRVYGVDADALVAGVSLAAVGEAMRVTAEVQSAVAGRKHAP